jgi:hypothetical protein
MAFLYASNIQDGTGVLSYAVRMASYIQADLSIVHNFDPRCLQGRYSPISDSQSVTMEPQLGEEILEKKQNEIENILKLFFPDFLEKIAKSSKLPFLFFHENMIKKRQSNERQDGRR